MCSLFCNIAAKRVERLFCAFYHPRSNLSCQKIILLQVVCILASDWIKLRGSHAIHGYTGVTSLAAKQVCLGPVSLRGRRLKGKGKGALGKGVLGARGTRGAREGGVRRGTPARKPLFSPSRLTKITQL